MTAGSIQEITATAKPAVGRTDMNCEDLLKALNDYVDGDIDPSVCEKFEVHLADCNPCQVVVDNIRQTIRLYRAGEPYEVPPECERVLQDALRRKWAEKFPGAAGASPPEE
jgi:anti-sigma factor RsiW